MVGPRAVSYTHLDVYKRQVLDSTIEFISAVKSGVESEGYQLGTAESYGSLPSSRILLVLMGLGLSLIHI